MYLIEVYALSGVGQHIVLYLDICAIAIRCNNTLQFCINGWLC